MGPVSRGRRLRLRPAADPRLDPHGSGPVLHRAQAQSAVGDRPPQGSAAVLADVGDAELQLPVRHRPARDLRVPLLPRRPQRRGVHGRAARALSRRRRARSTRRACRTPTRTRPPQGWPTFKESGLYEGKQIYASHCMTCHGCAGNGLGTYGGTLIVTPANFKVDPFRTMSDEQWFWHVSEGIQGSVMPPWKESLTESQRWNVIHYVQQMYASDVRARSRRGRRASRVRPEEPAADHDRQHRRGQAHLDPRVRGLPRRRRASARASTGRASSPSRRTSRRWPTTRTSPTATTSGASARACRGPRCPRGRSSTTRPSAGSS